MSFDFNRNEFEEVYDSEEEDENNSIIHLKEKNNELYNQQPQNLGESMSTVVSLEKSGNIEAELKNSLNIRQSQYQIMPSSFINKNEDAKNKIIREEEKQNKIENIEYQNILNCIIVKGQIINSVIISEKEEFINLITMNIMNYILEQNKKICFLCSELKKAQYIYELYKDKPNVRALLLQKNKGKKTKNEYQSYIKLMNENNFFIFLPNVFYKLLSIGFVKIYDFSLIIFDECHLCDSNHPYNIIMQEFYFYYYINQPEKKNILPKIIGFTNSPYKDKNIVKNNKKCAELLKDISENLNCQMVIDPTIFDNENHHEENVEYIEVDSFLKEKNKVEGINIILMKFLFYDMLDICLDDYLNNKGETSELNSSNKNDIKNKYINTLKEKFSSETFEKYNSVETSERSLHFLSTNSIMFQIFEDIQKHLINIIQNLDLEEIYNFFEKYKNLYENNLKKQRENGDNKYQKRLYKNLIFIFKVNMRAFKRLLDKNIVYKTDRLIKFINKLIEIYNNNKNSKTFIFVPNRKMANLIFNYLNRDKKDNKFKNKVKFIIGANAKKDENVYLTLATRITLNEINERIKEYNENKINILICTPPAIDYLNKEKCDYILIFSELSNSNNDYEKVKKKAKICKAKLIIFGNEPNKIDDSLKEKKDKELIQLKNLFMEGEKIKNPKNFRNKDFIQNKNIDKNNYIYIDKTEAKMSLKNCMLLFNEISNKYLSNNINIKISKQIIPYEDEQKFICKAQFQKDGDAPIDFTSNKYNDKQSAENECYLSYIIYLYRKRQIDEHFRVKI